MSSYNHRIITNVIIVSIIIFVLVISKMLVSISVEIMLIPYLLLDGDERRMKVLENGRR